MSKITWFWPSLHPENHHQAPPVTASVLLTITILNFNHTLENVHTMDAINFIERFSDRVVECFAEGTSYCCFAIVVPNNYFQKVLLINFICTFANSLQHFIFARFLLIEDYGKYTLWKEQVIATFAEQFQKMVEKVLLMNSICTHRYLLHHFIFGHLLLIEDYEQGTLQKGSIIATFIEWFKAVTVRKS